MSWPPLTIGPAAISAETSAAQRLPQTCRVGSTTPISTSILLASFGGAQAGCNYEFSSKWVVGIEGDWDWTRLNSSSLIGPAVPGATYYANVNEVATLRARLGYAWDTMMLYATGGGAWA